MNIDLNYTINSGQVFLWEKRDSTWYGINGNQIIVISTKITKKHFKFFRKDDNTSRIITDISKDARVLKAVNAYPGLSLLRQDPFQCLISFITSSNSNIPRIRHTLQNLCKTFGKVGMYKNERFHLFPQADILADATESELLKCGLGYRAPFVKSAAQDIATDRINFKSLAKSNYKITQDALISIDGVGCKVADCVMLFSLDKLDAFPIDRWTMQILNKYYSKKISLSESTLTTKRYMNYHDMIVKYFGIYCGYAQQYLFKLERDQQNRKWL